MLFKNSQAIYNTQAKDQVLEEAVLSEITIIT